MTFVVRLFCWRTQLTFRGEVSALFVGRSYDLVLSRFSTVEVVSPEQLQPASHECFQGIRRRFKYCLPRRVAARATIISEAISCQSIINRPAP